MDRHVEIAEHLWLVLETMARDMGTDPRSLVNQAVFNWARRNGYPVMSMALAAVDTPVVMAPPAPLTRPAPAALATPPKPQPVADEATRAVDPDSPAALLMRPRDPADELSAARTAAAARIVAIDRALDDILPAPGRLRRERSHAGDGAATPAQRIVLELHIEGTSDTIIVDNAPVVIGRARHCTLVVESPQVSREHAIITKVGTSYILEDKGSANGTFVGDQQIKRHELRDGDICHIGTATVLVSIRAGD